MAENESRKIVGIDEDARTEKPVDEPVVVDLPNIKVAPVVVCERVSISETVCVVLERPGLKNTRQIDTSVRQRPSPSPLVVELGLQGALASLIVQHPDWTIQQYASATGTSRATLYRRGLARWIRQTRTATRAAKEPRRGKKGKDGSLEVSTE